MAKPPAKPKDDEVTSDELDEALAETFPASDPVAIGQNRYVGAPRRPAKPKNGDKPAKTPAKSDKK